MSVCARNGCDKIGKKACSACRKELYCCSECQKEDWKSHKIICNILKYMPNAVAAENMFNNVIIACKKALNLTEAQISKLGKKRYMKLLERAESFAEHQFGEKIAGDAYYYRDQPMGRHCIRHKINAVEVDVECLNSIYIRHAELNGSCDNNEADNVDDWAAGVFLIKGIHYLKKSIAILEPWIFQLGLPASERTNLLVAEDVNNLFMGCVSCYREALRMHTSNKAQPLDGTPNLDPNPNSNNTYLTCASNLSRASRLIEEIEGEEIGALKLS
jgi:hypothetical protein